MADTTPTPPSVDDIIDPKLIEKVKQMMKVANDALVTMRTMVQRAAQEAKSIAAECKDMPEYNDKLGPLFEKLVKLESVREFKVDMDMPEAEASNLSARLALLRDITDELNRLFVIKRGR